MAMSHAMDGVVVIRMVCNIVSSWVATLGSYQWRRQRSKAARSFRGQTILQPGHSDAFFPQKYWRPFLVVALETQAAKAASPSK